MVGVRRSRSSPIEVVFATTAIILAIKTSSKDTPGLGEDSVSLGGSIGTFVDEDRNSEIETSDSTGD